MPAGGGLFLSGNSVSSQGNIFEVVSDSYLKLGEGVSITECSATVSGVAVYNAGTFTLNGAKIYGNELTASGKYGIIYTSSGGTFNLVSGSIYNNTVVASGVIFFNNLSTFKMTGGEIYSNSTSTHGTIYIKSADVTLSGGKIYSNSASESGGGMYILDSATVKLCGTEISQNTATNYGAGIYLTGEAALIFSSGSISSNISGKSGAGLFITGSATFEMTGGTITGNYNSYGNGGAFVNKSIVKISGGIISGNSAISVGGAIYNDGGTLEIIGGTITKNTAGTNGGALNNTGTAIISGGTITLNSATSYGGAIYSSGSTIVCGGIFSGNTAETGGAFYNNSGTFEISNGTISGNGSTANGGGIYNEDGSLVISGGTISGNYNSDTGANGGGIASYSTTSAGATVTITGGTITGNYAVYRGADVYGYAKSGGYSTLQILGGTLGQVNAQYCLVELGGDFNMTNLTFNASIKADYAFVNIVSGLSNDVQITPHSTSVETLDTENKFIRYSATDSTSNIYQSARHIILDSDTVFVTVEDNTILLTSSGYKIDIDSDFCIVDAPLTSASGSTVTFSVFEGYQLLNVGVVTASGVNIEVTYDGTYSFTMPSENVTISYTYSFEDLELTVDPLIEGLISCEETYTKNEEVTITILDSDIAKIVTLYLVDGDTRQELEITNSTATFYMFKGAKITADILYYHDISFDESNLIKNVNLNSEKTLKGLEGEIISFTLEIDDEGENARYSISSVYYYILAEKIEIVCDEFGEYCFVMPTQDVEICFEFDDLLEDYVEELVFVETYQELSSAISGEKSIIVLIDDITLENTLAIGEGEYTIITIKDYSIIRGNQLSRNMFEIGYLSTLNLSLDLSGLGIITIDGNSNNVTACGSAFYVYNSGILNIYSGAVITNNSLTCTNFMYSEYSKGNASAGGSAVYVYNGIVNMYGGEICDNYSTSSGSAVYNFGRFNLYGGSIHDNECTSNGTIYNIRVLNIDGGTIENNTAKYGGAVYNASSYYAFVYLVSGEVSGNTATKSGGAFYVGYKSVTWIKGGSLTSNTATNNGGAINSRGTLFVLDGSLSQNEAGSKGGAIYAYGKNTYIRGGIFSFNAADLGGAICFANEVTAQVTDGTFTNNSAVYGGAICLITAAQVEISGGVFSYNTATTRGGGIYLKNDKSLSAVTTLTITGGSLFDNSSEKGDAVCVQYAILKIGGDVSIDGLVQMVATPTENYAYIEFIYVPTNTIKLRPVTYTSALDSSVPNFIRVSDGVDIDAVVEKIAFSSTKYEAKVENGEIVVSKIEE